MTYAIINKEFKTIKIFCKDDEEFKARCLVNKELIERGKQRRG